MFLHINIITCRSIKSRVGNLMNIKEYNLIDLLKFLFAICVVGIHTNIAGNSKSTFQWYILNCVFRLAVPFFFCLFGFFSW